MASSRATEDQTISVPDKAIAMAMTSSPLIVQPKLTLKKLAISGNRPANTLDMNLSGPTSENTMPISLISCMAKKPTPSASEIDRKNCHMKYPSQDDHGKARKA